jgi:hypothetical protein
MNPNMPINRSRWAKELAGMALREGLSAMNFELYNGRWCINIFGGFEIDDDYQSRAVWKTVTVQEFYKDVMSNIHIGECSSNKEE